LQTLDEAHLMEISGLDIDCQLGYSICLNQYVFSKKNLRNLGFKTKTYLLYEIPEDLINGKYQIHLNYNETFLVPNVNRLEINHLYFVIETLFDYAKLSNIMTDELTTTVSNVPFIRVIENDFLSTMV